MVWRGHSQFVGASLAMSNRVFLIVGAMKAGTTTLYRDLYDHPQIYLPEQKEPELLIKHPDLAGCRAAYKRLWSGAEPGQICGEASTGYTKRPDHEGIAQRAYDMFGPELRVIYLERDPIARAISHYRHNVVEAVESRAIDDALLNEPRYLDYGRYDWQIAPWIAAFGADAVLRLEFEQYVTRRLESVETVCTHLGVDPSAAVPQDQSAAFNSSSDKFVARGWKKTVVESDWFQLRLKPLFSANLRRRLMPLVVPRAGESERTISAETRRILEHRIAKASSQ